MEAASLTASVSEAEDVDVAQEEHEAGTGYEVIGKEGEPFIIDTIVTQEKLFRHQKVRNDIIDGKKKLEEKCLYTIVPTKVLFGTFEFSAKAFPKL